MPRTERRPICWVPTWSTEFVGIGAEHLLVSDRIADSVLVAVDDDGLPFHLSYRPTWDANRQLVAADLRSSKSRQDHSLSLRAEGGRWTSPEGENLDHLAGCTDIDIWPTPFTNSFPIWRSQLEVGERREFLMAWVNAPALTVEAKLQAYTCLAEHRYLFESLDETGFRVELQVDAFGIVLDYPGLFRRVAIATA